MDACFNLIDSTSGEDYRSSSAGWHPEAKRREMRSPGLRYILVTRDAAEDKETKGNEAAVEGFTSLMPTFENGEPVVYCYEIHLSDLFKGYVMLPLLPREVFMMEAKYEWLLGLAWANNS